MPDAMEGSNDVSRRTRHQNIVTLTLAALVLPLLLAGAARPAQAAQEPAFPHEFRADPQRDGPKYPVAGFRLQYSSDHPRHPVLEEFLDIQVRLGQVDDGYVEPRAGVPETRIVLRVAPYTNYYASAIRAINQQVVSHFNEKGLIGVLVAPLETEIEPGSGKDLRKAGQVNLNLVVRTGRVEEVRTFAAGDRFDAEERLNAPQHGEIAGESPAQASGERELMMREDLERYTARLNRHPGRRVDIEVSPGLEPGGVYLDYMVAEYRPWYAYAQFSNLGTDGTSDYRQRLGFVHTQLTNHDDILRLDYVTGNFNDVNAVIADYEAPVFGFDFDGRLRWRAFGNWTEYESSILGFGDISFDKFEGESWTAGLHLIANVFQYKELFVDLIVGARWLNVEADDHLNDLQGKDDFFIPRLGMLVERRTDTSYFSFNFGYERNFQDIAGTTTREINRMGRLEVDKDFDVLRMDVQLSFYLEPLIFGKGFDDPSDWWNSTLAHELFFSARGQYALGERLIPNEVMTVGGLYTVRGYPEAAAYGDRVWMGTAEYRLHIPRLLRPRPGPARQVPLLGEFRGRPQYVFGRPDWDLILRVFTEAGRAVKTSRIPGEYNNNLWGAGVGLELLLKRNISLRFDAAQALTPVRGSSETIHDNSREYRWLITILY
jgi:hemolysin activation/secretion protein